MHISTILKHYKRKDIQDAMVQSAVDREIAVKFGDKGFGKRPDLLENPHDVIEFAKQGVTSFHVGEEHWENPMLLGPQLKREEMNQLRSGWDLILDIDCPIWEYSKLTTHLLVQALKHHGIQSVSVKFSGNKGFHIGVPFKAFPLKVQNKDTRLWFPDGARKIAEYLGNFIQKPLAKKIGELHDIAQIEVLTNKERNEFLKNNEINPFVFIDIDTVLITSRHLYRMVYSLHEKSGLVSIPIDPNSVLEFEKTSAKPDNLTISNFTFLDDKITKAEEAHDLFIQAFDHKIEVETQQKKETTYEALQDAIPDQFFPPCIKKGLSGMEDGKKRFLFILKNFLSSVGYTPDQMDEIITQWNKKNPEELREVILEGQIRHMKRTKKSILPPNCDNRPYYIDLQICNPDGLCKKIKNPVQYAKRRAWLANHESREKEQKEKEKEAQKAFKKQMKEKLANDSSSK